MSRLMRRCAGRPWFAVLLLISLLSRTLIPVGFMPGPGGLMLCPGYAPVLTASGNDGDSTDMSGMDMTKMDMPGMGMSGRHSGAPSNHPDHESQGVCPFAAAAAATAMVMIHMAPTTTLSKPVSTLMLFPPDQFLPRGTIVPTRLPRGPPSYS